MTGAVNNPPGRICKLCRRKRPFAEFVWEDKQGGRTGVTGRCVTCRNCGPRPDPRQPTLRYPLTRHAVERYVERVRPEWIDEFGKGKAHWKARLEMKVRMAYAPWVREWPEWLADRELHRDEDVGHLLIDDDTLFLLSADPNGTRVVVTVLTRNAEPA